jgi:hypothetical protein
VAVTGRDIAVCAFAVLTAVCLAGTAGAFAMRNRGRPPGAVVFVLGPSLTCGLWAAYGWGSLAVTALGWTPVLAVLGAVAAFAVLVVVLALLERDKGEKPRRDEGDEP